MPQAPRPHPRILQQWLQTDAALGATDAPFPSAPRRRPRGVSAPTVVPQPSMPPPISAAPPTPRPPARAIAPHPIPTAPAPSRKPAPAPSPLALPPTPPGEISDLPSLTPAQKSTLLADLQSQSLALLTPHLNDVATNIVFGEGDPNAPLLFVGEGPGIEEDKTGRPFVGRAGIMLDKWIAAMGYARPAVYIANVVKLRAADWDPLASRLKDRPPTPDEVALNIPILHQQIQIIRPRAIVTLGAPAVKWLTGSTEGVMKLRGRWLSYRGIPLMPTYHPAFLLRAYTEENRRKVWSDLQTVLQKLQAAV